MHLKSMTNLLSIGDRFMSSPIGPLNLEICHGTVRAKALWKMVGWCVVSPQRPLNC